MIRIVIITCLFVTVVCDFAKGQLIERESVTSKIQNGTRPEQGDFGFTLQGDYVSIKELIDENVDVRGLPLMNFNYYIDDNLETTLGLQIYKTSKRLAGTLLDDNLGEETNINIESNYKLSVGVNYHFSPSNILDTYSGFSLIAGKEVNEIQEGEKTSIIGDYYSNHYTKNTFVWGAEFKFGVRAFIADLPFSLGLELGIMGLSHTNLEYKTVTESSIGGVETSQTYYTKERSAGLRYSSLEYAEFELGANIRAGLSYYFR